MGYNKGTKHKKDCVMKKKILTLALSLVLVFCSAFSLVSCALANNSGYMTREEVQKLLDAKTAPTGDSYNVEINSDGTSGLLPASHAMLSTVSVYCTFTVQYVYGFGFNSQVKTAESQSAGSGVIYRLDKQSGDAYIITNYHVVYNSDATSKNGISENINLYLYGQESAAYAIPATYVGGSLYYDIAVLKVKGSDVLRQSNAIAATFADSDTVSVLDTAIAIGNPEANGLSVTVGYVNVDSEYINITGADNSTTVSLRVMRIDAAVNSGNSGGGLYNDKGELIGIVNAKMSSSTVDNIGYAIPSNIAKYITENILYYCDNTDKESVYRCMIGITLSAKESYTEYDTESGKVYKRETVEVSEVTSSATGLQKTDVIRSITIDGKDYAVTRLYHVIDSMLNARVGNTVVFHITRAGTDMDITVSITESMLTKY